MYASQFTALGFEQHYSKTHAERPLITTTHIVINTMQKSDMFTVQCVTITQNQTDPRNCISYSLLSQVI